MKFGHFFDICLVQNKKCISAYLSFSFSKLGKFRFDLTTVFIQDKN